MSKDTKFLKQLPKFKEIVGRLNEIAENLPEVVVKADGDFQADRLRDIIKEFDDLGSSTQIHGGGTGND